ncbi:MAG TPA: peptidoglycan editing factor PgeF [Balneolaceae bacterium]|nr:peptidoglycan editing factor PgeF [Balneolaceae bacterium]
MPIDVIIPDIFKKEEHIKAFFTLKNDNLFSENRTIRGLNLGFNTDEDPEIIRKNRQYLFDAFDIDTNWIAFANQVHSNRVKVVTSGGTFAETDGLITQVPGLALAIQIADCPAVLIADLASNTVAAVHAGWRGAAGDILPNTMEKLVQLGVKTESCKAFISPCISVQNFEVGQEVAERFPVQFVDEEHFKKPHVDLKLFLKHQLQQAGLHSGNIEIHPDCTMDGKKYYSYRREKEKSGRMMAVIMLQR